MKIGVTGGIGSGKSFICSIIEKMGYPVYYSDFEAKTIVNNDPDVRRELIALLGSEVYLSSNEINRDYLAQKIFTDEKIKHAVNGIIHPAVRNRFNDWSKDQLKKVPMVFNEAAILFETGSYKSMDKNILVIASQQDRIKRVTERDGSTVEEVRKRMNNQWTDAEKIPLSDYQIYNNNEGLLLPKIEKVIDALLMEIK